jgi:hypothetical protein
MRAQGTGMNDQGLGIFCRLGGRLSLGMIARTLLGVLVCLVFRAPVAPAQNVEGQIIASQYGQWQVPGYAPDTYSGFAPATCRVQGGASFFPAFTAGTPLRIVDSNPSLTEVVVPSSVVDNASACSVSIQPAHHHQPPFYFTSGTAGLQEAINANLSMPGPNTIILNNEWYQLGGSATIIADVQGSSSLGIIDVTTAPTTWYQWNGTHYVQVEAGTSGVNSINGTEGPFTFNGSGVSCSGSTCSFTGDGVDELNGQKSSVNLTSSGGTIVVTTPSPGTIDLEATGAAGAGNVGSGSYLQKGYYPNSGSAATVGPITNEFAVPPGLSASSISTFLAGCTDCAVDLQPGTVRANFTNPNHDTINDLRTDVPVDAYPLTSSGAACDLKDAFVGFTSGSTTFTIGNVPFSASDVGKYLEVVGSYNGLPTRFDAQITGATSASQGTMSTPAPFTGNFSADFGHLDNVTGVTTSPWQDAAAFGNTTRPISLPVGNCWGDTFALTGQSVYGQGVDASFLTARAGEDVLSTMDPSASGFVGNGTGGQRLTGFTINFDARIDTTQPWQDISSNGTVTAHAARYRPIDILTGLSNDPFGTAWIVGPGANGSGTINGVASTTAGSANICVLSASVPAAGSQIIFPYFPALFVTTTTTAAGTCTSGTPLTLSAAIPTGDTLAQAEFFAGEAPGSSPSGTAIQKTTSAFPVVSARATAKITAFSITSNVVTFTASNTFVAGQEVTVFGLSTGTYLNGQHFTVSSTGLSSTQFEAAFTYGNVASTTDTGTANPYPFTVTLANNINPSPNGPSNMAPFGLIEVASDGGAASEQCVYYGTSQLPATGSTTYSINITGCAQNGTTAEPHSSGSVIFPLNMYEPTYPWPVSPTINGSSQTPANAEYYPGLSVGVCGLCVPNYNGSSYSPQNAFAYTTVDHLVISEWPGYDPYATTTESLANATTGIYMVSLPFNSQFDHVKIVNPQIGIAEGAPSINTNGYFTNGFPTADGNHWSDITIQSAAFDVNLIGGGPTTYQDWTNFCDNGGEPGSSYPGIINLFAWSQNTNGQNLGCGSAYNITGPWDDLGYGTSGPTYGGSWGVTNSTFSAWYLEAEFGPLAETEPMYELDCNICEWTGMRHNGGGLMFTDGDLQKFEGGSYGMGSTLPLINYGSGNVWTNAAALGANPHSNVYGYSGFLNWGPNTKAEGVTENIDGSPDGTYGPLAYGSRETYSGQNMDMLNMGITSHNVVNSNMGFFPAYEFTTGMSTPWIPDNDPNDVMQGYVGCNLTTTAFNPWCNVSQFGGGSLTIGPGQRLTNGKYAAYILVRESAGSPSQSAGVQIATIGACTTGVNEGFTVPITTSWTIQRLGDVDFTGSSGCTLQVAFDDVSSAAAEFQLSYLAFAPVTEAIDLNGSVVTSGAAAPTLTCPGTMPSGVPVGSMYINQSGAPNTLYICQPTGWVGK